METHVADAVALGAKVVTGGERAADVGRSSSSPRSWPMPARRCCARARKPLDRWPVFKFQTEDEAIALANATEFGLASYFYSRDIARVFRVAEALEYGMVGINTGLIATAEAPFGGVGTRAWAAEGTAKASRIRRTQDPLPGRPRALKSTKSRKAVGLRLRLNAKGLSPPAGLRLKSALSVSDARRGAQR